MGVRVYHYKHNKHNTEENLRKEAGAVVQAWADEDLHH